MKDNRYELIKGDKITVSGKDYIVDSVIGCGASCICYKAYETEPLISDGNREIKAWMAIKEFYPLNIAIRNSSMKVVPASDDIKEWEKAQIHWREGIDKGREFQAKDGNDFMEIEAVDASYSVMRLRRGMTLEEWVGENVREAQGDSSDDEYGRTKYVVKCLDILRDLCACIEKYQDAGIIHLDVKPENIYILDDNNNKRIVRLIDYDSLMNKDEFYKIASGDGKISMYSTKEYYGEEVWSQRSDWKAAAKDENVWKQVDVYALGKVLQYMFTGNADDALFFDDNFEWFKDKDSIIERTSSRRYVLNEFINRATNVFGRRYSDAKILKFVIENIQGLFNDDNYNKFFDGFNKYRDELVPELIVDGISYTKRRGKAPVVQVFEEYCANQNKNICIVAESGMGKSTALRKLFLDKILENQREGRFYYYRLRECSDCRKAQNLWREIKAKYNYPNAEHEYYLLDAFDESNEAEDVRETLEEQLKAPSPDCRFILTNRYEIKELKDIINVTCGKINKIVESDELKRIKQNSSWLEEVGIDIFQNPLFITMAENTKLLENYIRNDKVIGPTAWKKIEKELLGEYVDGKLTVNYAGELIWNYVYITILSKFVLTDRYSEVLDVLHSESDIYKIYEINENIVWREKFEKEAGYTVLKNVDIISFLNSNKRRSEKMLKESSVSFNLVFGIAEKMILHNDVLLDFFKARTILEKNESRSWRHFLQDYAGGKWRGLKTITNLAMEISGAKYNDFELQGDVCFTNIEEKAYKMYADKIYVADKKIDFSGSKLKISKYQAEHRYFIFDKVNKFKTFCLLMTQNLKCMDFSGMDLRYITNTSNWCRILKDFHSVEYCNFSKCEIWVKSGKFKKCKFQDLQEGSYLNPEIYLDNDCDRVYETQDKFGNKLTYDGKYLIELYDYNTILDPVKEKIIKILPGALRNCINETLIFSEENIREIDFYPCTDNGKSDVIGYKHLKNVIVKGDAVLRHTAFIDNLAVCDNSRYIYQDGILYDSRYTSKKSNYIVHINKNLPSRIRLLIPVSDFIETIMFDGEGYMKIGYVFQIKTLSRDKNEHPLIEITPRKYYLEPIIDG